MSSERTKKHIEHIVEDDLARVATIRNEDIDYSDNPPVRDFSKAEVGKFYRPVKDQVTLRVDRPVLQWFRENNDKYQTAINQVLLDYMKEQRRAEMRRRIADEDSGYDESSPS